MRSKGSLLFQINFRIVLFIVFMLLNGNTFAQIQNLEQLLTVNHANDLLTGEKPVLAQFSNPRPVLVPNNQILQGFLRAIQQELEPGIMVETLNIYQKPEGTGGRAWSREEAAGIYNSVTAISSLAGIQYYSATRSSMRTFYETSSVIDGPSSRTNLPDPYHANPPGELTLYARQRDGTFGDNVYRYDYYFFPGAIIFIQENMTALSYGILPAVSRNRLRSIVAILDTEDHILVYAASMARAASVPGIRDRMGTSFANRAEAIFQWFSDKADQVYERTSS